ncbi:hypothetical protein SEA_MUDSLIDE_64 [Mycobacterium phage Mudslide]|nr:hypothetical protein SEA_MUDSLIDE_64 [Mycobacterium phage Mudslide]
MDEWPELEALAQAMDAWDEWPGTPEPRAQAIIDKARDVVHNYRETKAMVATYKAMPVDADQVRRAMGLPPLGESEPTKACIEVPVPPGYDESADPVVRHARQVWDDFGQAMQPGHPTTHLPREEPGGDRHRDD